MYIYVILDSSVDIKSFLFSIKSIKVITDNLLRDTYIFFLWDLNLVLGDKIVITRIKNPPIQIKDPQI